MIGYLANARVGATTYNAVHTWVWIEIPEPVQGTHLDSERHRVGNSV